MKALAHIACAASTALLAACSGGDEARNDAAAVNVQTDMNAAVTTGPVLPVGNAAAPAAAPERSPPAAPPAGDGANSL